MLEQCCNHSKQCCDAVLRQKSSLRIVLCNIAFTLESCKTTAKKCTECTKEVCCTCKVAFWLIRPFGGLHVTSSPPCWWTVNKRSLISSFCLSTSICTFHHCSLCLPRLHENHLLLFFTVSFPSSLSIATLYILVEQTITEYHREL